MHLHADSLSYSYPDNEVFHNLTFTVNQGDRIAIVGENGCGKSTLLSILAGERDPHEGHITRDGTCTYVSQELHPHNDTLGDLIDAALAQVTEVGQELERASAAFDHDHGTMADLADLLATLNYLAPGKPNNASTPHCHA